MGSEWNPVQIMHLRTTKGKFGTAEKARGDKAKLGEAKSEKALGTVSDRCSSNSCLLWEDRPKHLAASLPCLPY